jgi:thiamine pyrophosphokinase
MNILILCNGRAPSDPLLEEALQQADFFIAADGGANIARSLGHRPDVVIGDLDSYQKKEADSFKIIHKPSQYANDLEKALQLAHTKEASSVTVLGATGLRLDHTLKNLSVLKQFNSLFESLIFRDDFGSTQLLPKEFSKEIEIDTPVSLFPLSGKVSGITTHGLKYPLNDESIENGIRDGSSNTVTESPVQISHASGDLLLFIAHT